MAVAGTQLRPARVFFSLSSGDVVNTNRQNISHLAS